jgi:hypothetical protein
MRLLHTAGALLLLAAPTVAHAGAFTQHGGAVPLAMNTHAVGAYVFSSDDQLGLQGDLRMSIYPGVDFGFQGGLSRLSTDSGDRGLLRFGTDVQAEIRAGEGMPLALGVGGAFGVEVGDDYVVLSVGPEFRISRSFALGQSAQVTPYGGMVIAFNRTDVNGQDQVDPAFPIRVGADFQTGGGIGFLMEFQLTKPHEFADDFLFSAGARMPF